MVEEVPDPQIKEPHRRRRQSDHHGSVCASDLDLYGPLGPFMTPGGIVDREPMGIVQEVGSAVQDLKVGDRVMVSFNISCGSCRTCGQGPHSQCETTRNRETGAGASLLGYSKLYGAVPGGQAEYLRVQFADSLRSRC